MRRVTVALDAARAQARLRRLADEAERAVAAAVAGEAAALAAAAHELAPVADGTLRDSIGVATTDAGLGAAVGSDAPHAAFVEFGTRRRAARPFLGPAWTAARQGVRRGLAAAVRGVLP